MKDILRLLVADLQATAITVAVMAEGKTGEAAKSAGILISAQQKTHFDKIRKLIDALPDTV